MASEDYGNGHRTGYAASDNDAAMEQHIEAAINDEAYAVWQENGRDDDLENVIERMNQEFQEKRLMDDSDPDKPGWITDVQETARRRIQAE